MDGYLGRLLSWYASGPDQNKSRREKLDAPTAARRDGSRHHRRLGDWSGPRCDGLGYDSRLGDRMADDPDPSDPCWSERHVQSPSVVVASSASIEAIIAWIGIR